MTTDIKNAVIEVTAGQLGIEKKDVTMATIIPDIHGLTIWVGITTGKVVAVDLQADYTVKRAIKELEL